ncbi:MAG: hybrid sensor histidine kinase/response regulator [Dokdonella sp.]|uniref:ATP-binding response regulator n=1 Tax=Dokdonella sp. TaxID=2291710 RepID=UPI0032644CC1
MTIDAALPPRVETYLRERLFRRAHPLMLSFDAGWQLLDAQGDAAFYGIDVGDAASGVRAIEELFIGLAVDDDQDIPFVELGHGRSAHVHLIADGPGFHVLLLDAEDERSRQRAQQQLGHEAAMAGHEKSKAIGRLRDIRTELERQRASLEEANALKNALIATLSHEFRTPLTSIFGYLHLIERWLDRSEHSSQALNAIRRNATYLLTLAENLLEYGRGDDTPGLLNPVEVDLRGLFTDIDTMVRPLADDKQLDFRARVIVEDSAAPLFDEVRVRQIAINLLSNAVRYTGKGFVAFELAWRNGVLHIDVEDSGIGIPPDYRERVFTPFNDGAQSGRKGAGLGLSIVRRLVAQMRGTLQMETEQDRGTHFRIDLPLLPALPLASGQRDHDEAPPPRMQDVRVMVVDDDPDIAHLLEALLTDLGCRVLVAENAMAAVDHALADAPDVLLIDVEMPGLSGNAAVFKLRSRGYRGRIVTLSATSTPQAREASLRAGADFYLTKPLHIEQFVGVMQRAAQCLPKSA